MSDESGVGPPHYYEGWRGGLRLIGEVLAETPPLLREDAYRVLSKLRGEGTVDGESCGIKNCSRDGVSMFSPPKRWKSDFPICRRHWLMMLATKAVLYGLLLLSVPAALLYVMMVVA